MLMTLVLPGSAQIVAGRKDVGRIAMRIWFGLIITVVLFGLIGLMSDMFVLRVLTGDFELNLIRFALMGLAIGWAYLFVDAWRIGDPLALAQKQRLAMVGINGFLCFSVCGSLLFASHLVSVERKFISEMFGDGKAVSAVDGRYNVLLLGGDSGADRWGLRPDSISVASIDAKSGKTVIFGLPRNMLNFPFAEGSIMDEQFPDGYDCGRECELNSLATWAADHKGLFKGVDNPGVEATSQAVEGITGLKIHYFAMVNLKGFRKMVDALGGVTLNVRDRIPIGGVGGPVTGYIEPGTRKLNGFDTLWFARSRESADDYSRMARQKCVMGAMLQQLSPMTVVTKFQAIAEASTELISTNVPRSELPTFVKLADKARSQPLKTVSFVPPMINTGSPDIAKIQRAVENAINGKKIAKKPVASTQGSTGGAVGSMSSGYAANQSDDLNSVC